uniref:EF-hand domain-containing protein n=1 Tax=Hyaloperonospora arabidopsidis (strain Emoy2) TaxID=559515 RepID=M4BGV0_HYAAE
MDEDTPLLREVTVQEVSSPGSPSGTMSPSVASESVSTAYGSLQTTELELNVDKISFLFSPSIRPTYGSGGEYNHYAEQPLQETLQTNDKLNMLEPYFDVTPSRLRVAFEGSGTEGDGELSYNGFRAALKTLGIRCLDNAVFAQLVKSIDKKVAAGSRSCSLTLQCIA